MTTPDKHIHWEKGGHLLFVFFDGPRLNRWMQIIETGKAEVESGIPNKDAISELIITGWFNKLIGALAK